MSFSGRLLTEAIKTLLTTAGLLVGIGDKPVGGGWQGTPGASTFKPYTIIWPTVGGVYDGTIGEPFSDARPDYTITSYGATSDQAQWGDDKVFATLTTTKPTVSGRVVQLAIPDVQAGAQPDYDVTPPVFFAPARWRIYDTSA